MASLLSRPTAPLRPGSTLFLLGFSRALPRALLGSRLVETPGMAMKDILLSEPWSWIPPKSLFWMRLLSFPRFSPPPSSVPHSSFLPSSLCPCSLRNFDSSVRSSPVTCVFYQTSWLVRDVHCCSKAWQRCRNVDYIGGIGAKYYFSNCTIYGITLCKPLS